MESDRLASHALRERCKKRTIVGAAITIKGEVSGGQDLLVQGRIEGRISLPGRNITVGREGWVKADLVGKRIRVDGIVEGSIQGEEEIRVTGCIQGDLIAPRVVLEKGCQYRGTVATGVPSQSSSE